MLGRFFRSKPRRLYVGTLGVAAPPNITRQFEEFVFMEPADLDLVLLGGLNGIFSSPAAGTVEAPLPSDLAYDVALRSYRFGGVADPTLGLLQVPLAWRPRIRLDARLYYLKTNKTKATFSVTQRMPWAEYLVRVLSPRVLMGWERLGRRSDLERLLHRACQRLKARIEAAA
jgi:hypothetical protein